MFLKLEKVTPTWSVLVLPQLRQWLAYDHTVHTRNPTRARGAVPVTAENRVPPSSNISDPSNDGR